MYKAESPNKDYMEEKERKTGKFKLAGGSTGLLSAGVQTNDMQENENSLIISMFSNKYVLILRKLD